MPFLAQLGYMYESLSFRCVLFRVFCACAFLEAVGQFFFALLVLLGTLVSFPLVEVGRLPELFGMLGNN